MKKKIATSSNCGPMVADGGESSDDDDDDDDDDDPLKCRR